MKPQIEWFALSTEETALTTASTLQGLPAAEAARRVLENGPNLLPKEFRFDEEDVVIRKIGDLVVLLPRKYRAESLLAMLESIEPVDLERQRPVERQERDSG